VATGELTIRDLTSRAHVVQAIEEFDSRRRDGFLRHYGYGPSLKYRLRYRGKFYDSKAIAGVAWGLQHFGDGKRRPASYTGGAHTSVAALRQLGFQVAEDEKNLSLPALQPGRTYTWEELGALFDFPPSYLSLAGGMISRPELGALLLITHSQDGESFSYGDEWKGKELIYAGRGLTGNQELKGQNRQVAETAELCSSSSTVGRTSFSSTAASTASTTGRAPASTKTRKNGASTGSACVAWARR